MIKIIGAIIIGVATLVGIASRWIFKKTDNVVEEVTEQIIRKQTGYTIDLSPDTPDPQSDIPLVDTILEVIDEEVIGLDLISTPKEPLKEEDDSESNKLNQQ